MKSFSIPIEKIAAWLIVIGGAYLILQYALAPLVVTLLPFALAWLLAYFARPLALRLHRHTHLSVGTLSVVLVFLFLSLCGTALFFALRQAAVELLALGERFGREEEWLTGAIAKAEAWWADTVARFPFLGMLGVQRNGKLADLLAGWLSEAGSRLGDAALRAAGTLASLLPNALIFLLVTLAAAFYFALDLGGIHRACLSLLPARMRTATQTLKEGAMQTVFGYFRTYMILMLVTFGCLCVGFLLLRVKYAVLLAALFSLLDLLPIIGVGMLLLPWGIFACLFGNFATGVGLFALWAVILLVRQLLEPRLIGHQLGLHPVPALLATYAGLKLFGFWGLMLLPGALMVLRHLFISQDRQAM